MVKPMKLKSSKSSTASSTIAMSSDVDDDQVLPDSLRKLEIVSVYTNSLAAATTATVACKTINERHQNPFLTELSTANSIDDRITKDLFGPSCSNCKRTDKRCIASSIDSIRNDVDNQNWRLNMGSGGSNSSSSGSSAGNSGNVSSNSNSTGINKTTHFKHRDREKASAQLLSEKKLAILREPILKSIGRSVYHNGHHQSKLCCEPKSCVEHKNPNNERFNVASSATVAGTQTEVLTNVSTATTATGHHKLCHNCVSANELLSVTDGGGGNGGMSECQNDSIPSNKTDGQRVATTQTNAVIADPNNLMIHRIQNWRLADDATAVDFKSLVNECNNLTLCTNNGTAANNSIIELHKTRNFQILQANQIDGTTRSGDTNDAHLVLSSNDGLSSTMQVTAGNNAMNYSLNNNNSNNSSSSSTNSSSCSQQARMNSSNCDVTIDELASYIEFQLHLPKPMSSNVYEAMFS